MPTYAVITFGCRVNQADSADVEAELLGLGASPAPPDAADVVVVNTCSVTASADQGARQTIRRIARVNPGARVIVTGCYATRRPDELAALPNVAAIVSNDDKPAIGHSLAAMVRSARADAAAADQTTAERYAGAEGSCGARLEPGVGGRTALTLRVQTGCAETCTYCIIPATRGRPRSVPVDDVVRQAAHAVGAGFKEIVLTGVHLGSYGRDLSPRSSLTELVARLARAAGEDHRHEVRFRISSLEPMDCTADIVADVAGHPALAPHFHLPLQHASGRMLRAMGRPYALEQFDRLVTGIRDRMPHASIGSDVIVGFPGEDEADFQELAAYLERSPLTHLHVFPYSDRPGTPAARVSSKVRGDVVRARAQGIRAISAALTARFHDHQLGTVHRALTIDDGTVAVTGNYLKVSLPEPVPRNSWVTVRVRGVRPSLRGEVVPAAAEPVRPGG